MKKLRLLFVCVFCAFLSNAQKIDFETRTTVMLDDNTEVILFGKMEKPSSNKDITKRFWELWPKNESMPSLGLEILNNEYYYLPPENSLRLSQSVNGKNQFNFIKYAGNTSKLASGGILFFNMEFGLTKEQEKELEQKLRKDNSRAKLKGSINLLPKVGEKSGMISVIIGKSDGSEETIATGPAPIGQGGKLTVSVNLNRVDTEIIEEVLKNKNTGSSNISVHLRYAFPAKVEGFSAKITFDEKKYKDLRDSFKRNTTHRQDKFLFFEGSQSHTMNQTRNFFEFLREEEVIKANISTSQYISEERAKASEDKFFEFFFQTFAQPTKLESAKDRSASIDSLEQSMKGLGETYRIKINDKTMSDLQKRSELELDHRVGFRFECGFGNDLRDVLDGENIDDYITTVDLDDPFFAFRVVTVGLDGALSDLVGEYINGINVRLRKEKKDGSFYYFEDQDPINFLTKGDAAKIMTYNASHDQGSSKDKYEYMTVVNYRGGKIEKTGWKPMYNDQIFITSKLVPKEITFQADPEELKEYGIVRAYLQLQYKQQGKSKTSEMHVSANGSNDVTSKILFMDDGKKAYGIRVIYFTKDGKQIPWKWKDQDFTVPFVYAAIPEKLRNMSSDEIDSFTDKHNLKFKETRDVLNSDGTLKKEVKDEAAEVFGNN